MSAEQEEEAAAREQEDDEVISFGSDAENEVGHPWLLMICILQTARSSCFLGPC